jgi:hypothetical protein
MSNLYGFSEDEWAKVSCRETICARLRGTYSIPVNDGAGPLNGSTTFVRTFSAPPIQAAAADLIEAHVATIASQAAQIGWLEHAINRLLAWCESEAGNGSNLSDEQVKDELESIELARAALQFKENDE